MATISKFQTKYCKRFNQPLR